MTRTPALIACAVVAWLVTPAAPPFDDAYIPLHAAHVVLEGTDAVYSVPALIGATSPPHVALLTVLVALHLPDMEVIRVGSALSMFAYLVALWALAAAVGLRGWKTVTLIAFGLLTGDICIQVTNGLETGIALASITGAIAAAIAGRIVVAAGLAGLLPWVRPDLTLIAGALWGYLLWNNPTAWRRLTIAGAAGALPWMVWLPLDTGHLVPNTLEAKRIYFAQTCYPLALKFDMAAYRLRLWVIGMAPLVVLGLASMARSLGRVLVVAAMITLGLYVVQFPGALDHNRYRYLYPLLVPIMAYGAALALREGPKKWLAVAACALIFLIPDGYRQMQAWRADGRELVALREWVDAHVPSGTRIASHDAGVLSMTDHQVVDLVGLKTPLSAEAHAVYTGPSCGARRSEAFQAILREMPAEYLVVASDWDAGFRISESLGAGRMLFRGPRYRVLALP